MICLLCREKGSKLSQCLLKLQPGRMTNYNRHKDEQHEEQIKKIEAEKASKMKGDKNVSDPS